MLRNASKWTVILSLAFILVGFCQPVLSADLSPSSWSQPLREQLEKKQGDSWYPSVSKVVSGKNGVVCAIASPIAVQAGIVALQKGGTAADAAATVALTQISTELGSVVSYAGVISLVYYDAKTQKVYSMDAGYNSYLDEKDPLSIPYGDLGPLQKLMPQVQAPSPGAMGRETLVPGFMAGLEAMHKRFGVLPFSNLFEPAIWYAEKGVVINSSLAHYFDMRKGCLNRTEEGRKFLKQAGNELPKLGDRFVQPELSQVLRNVAEHGASYMYTGDWGKHFVETVRREGGKVSLQDLAQYKVLWTEPLCTSYLGKKIYVAGMPNEASYHILTALNLAEEMKIEQQDDYWKNPAVLRDLQRISDLTNNAPIIDPKIATLMRSKNIDFSPEAQLTKDYAKAVAPMIAQFNPAPIDEPHHSNSLVVIDKDGNIAAITHTINSVCWGGTGIIVDGIPIPDSAGFQQRSLAAIKAGERLPNSMPQIIALSGNKPVFACAAIGSSMIPETIRIILGVLGKGTDLKTIQSAPPLLLNFKQTKTGTFSTHRGIDLTSGYDDSFVKGLEHLGENVKIVPEPEAGGLRGTVTAVTIDPLTGEKRGAEITNTLIFAECY